MKAIAGQLPLLILTSWTLVRSATGDMKSFKPVLGPDGKSIQCAADPPTAVIPLTDVSVGIPAGVPGAVVCSFGCTAYSGCSSYNYRKPRAAPAQCELYTTVPRNCSTITADEKCRHYEMAGYKRSCAPPACDTNCVDGCTQQGPGKCDSQCASGYSLATTHVCQLCDSHCVSGCTSQGTGKCDSWCANGYGLDGNNNCKTCSDNCLSGCSQQGAGKCDSKCESGYGLDILHVCQSCSANCQGICDVQGAGRCDSQCASGFGLNGQHVCHACSAKCVSGCAVQGAGKCDTQCASGFGLDENNICQQCDSRCFGACSIKGAGKCDSQCISGYSLAATYTCQRICPTGYSYVTYANSGTCYQLVKTHDRAWPVAESNCARDGAHLVNIESDDEQTAVMNFLTEADNHDSVWIGSCRKSDSTFVWSSECSNNGVPTYANTSIMTYLNWDSGEPKSSFKGCVLMDEGKHYKWAVSSCSEELNYICEYRF